MAPPTVRPPRWLGIVGVFMAIVGVLGFVGDVRAGGGAFEDVLGGFGFALDLALDVFLVVAGLVMFAVWRRAGSGTGR